MKAEIIKVEEGLLMMVDGNDNTAWAITEEEVYPIYMACQKWLDDNKKLIRNTSFQPNIYDKNIFKNWESKNKNGKEIK